ncbi:collagen alpha-2(IV) chain-like isoform X2 [Onthophagus taurus]|uniref:collagen alpha-2(IV) chain-like isoform X2 n=1 Tax=Onthophagus taurus TaxID=166361 RepID=UPI0039BE7663
MQLALGFLTLLATISCFQDVSAGTPNYQRFINNRKIRQEEQVRQGTIREYLPPINTEKPRPFEPSFPDRPEDNTIGYPTPPSGIYPPLEPSYPGNGPSKPEQPETPTKPGEPGYPGKPEEPGYPGKPEEPSYPGKPEEPGYPGKPEEPSYPGKPEEPGYPGKPEEPRYPGKPEEPGYPGYPGKPEEPGYPGKPEEPGYPGKPEEPVYPGKPEEPGYPGKPEEPGYPGKPEEPGYPGKPEEPGYPGKPEEPGYPGKPEEPGYPGQPKEPGKPEEPGYPGKPEEPGYPGKPEEPGYPGKPEEPGYPGKPEEPGYPGKPEEPGYPGKPEEPGYPGKPEEPGYPGKPEEPGYPGKPEEPGYPGKPEEPGYPGKPEEPGYPGKPEEPGYPGKPEEPGYPGKPEEPEYPGKPGEPGYPEKPEEPGYPGKPEEPAQPGKPEEPGYPSKPEQPVYPGQPEEPGYPGKPEEPQQPSYPTPGEPERPGYPPSGETPQPPFDLPTQKPYEPQPEQPQPEPPQPEQPTPTDTEKPYEPGNQQPSEEPSQPGPTGYPPIGPEPIPGFPVERPDQPIEPSPGSETSDGTPETYTSGPTGSTKETPYYPGELITSGPPGGQETEQPPQQKPEEPVEQPPEKKPEEPEQPTEQELPEEPSSQPEQPAITTKPEQPKEPSQPPTEDDLSHPPHIHALDVICDQDKMTITVEFNRQFDGIIYSKGHYNEPDCRYVNENSGQTKYEFTVYLNQCGTDLVSSGEGVDTNYLENVLVMQNEAGVQEVWDTVRAVRCHWEQSLKKSLTASLSVGMLKPEIVTFSGDSIMARLDIQQGEGPFAPTVNGLVPIGEKMTLVVSITGADGYDIQVKDCRAKDTQSRSEIILSDEDGCIIKPKLFGAFQKLNEPAGPILAYAFFNAFKFPDIMDLLIECNVELCKDKCEICSDPNQKVRPGRRRRDVYNETLTDPIRVGKLLRVLLPEDLSSGEAIVKIDDVEETVCVSVKTFVITTTLMISLLATASIFSAYIYLKYRRNYYKR